MRRPVVGVTVDVATLEGRERLTCSPAYAIAIERAGGVAMMLTPAPDLAPPQVERCDAIVLTGGDDPRTERYGEPTDPRITPVDGRRQAFEEALLAHLGAERPEMPVLGVCLGMQMMALVAGGRLDQYMPATCDSEGRHWDATHAIESTGAPLQDGVVFSRHKQCMEDAGSLEVIGRADDGVIEAVADPGRPFYVGVQWHPERTSGPLGAGVFEALVEAARVSRSASASP